MNCSFVSIDEDGPVHKYYVLGVSNIVYAVSFVVDDEKVSCNCKYFESIGLFCCHILFVLKNKRTGQISKSLLVGRWFRESHLSPVFVSCQDILQGYLITEERKRIVNDLWSGFHRSISVFGMNLDGLK